MISLLIIICHVGVERKGSTLRGSRLYYFVANAQCFAHSNIGVERRRCAFYGSRLYYFVAGAQRIARPNVFVLFCIEEYREE